MWTVCCFDGDIHIVTQQRVFNSIDAALGQEQPNRETMDGDMLEYDVLRLDVSADAEIAGHVRMTSVDRYFSKDGISHIGQEDPVRLDIPHEDVLDHTLGCVSGEQLVVPYFNAGMRSRRSVARKIEIDIRCWNAALSVGV